MRISGLEFVFNRGSPSSDAVLKRFFHDLGRVAGSTADVRRVELPDGSIIQCEEIEEPSKNSPPLWCRRIHVTIETEEVAERTAVHRHLPGLNQLEIAVHYKQKK